MSVVLDIESTKTLLDMLNSNDKGNRDVAFEAIKNLDIKENIGAISILFKHSFSLGDYWIKQAPNTKLVVLQLNRNHTRIIPTYWDIIQILNQYNASEEQVKLALGFYLNEKTFSAIDSKKDEIIKLFLNYERKYKKRTVSES